MIRAAAFDFDGTLVDSNEIKRRAYFEAARDLDPDGVAVEAVLERRPSGDRRRLAHLLAAELDRRGALPPQCSQEDVAKSLVEAYTDRCERAVSLCNEIPGATAALECLALRGLPLFLNTATPREAVLAILKRRRLERFFAGVYGAPASKLENLREIATWAGVRPEELLFVGDGEDDREAAAAFGCPFVGVVPAGSSRFHREPARQISDLAALPRILDELGGGPS